MKEGDSQRKMISSYLLQVRLKMIANKISNFDRYVNEAQAESFQLP